MSNNECFSSMFGCAVANLINACKEQPNSLSCVGRAILAVSIVLVGVFGCCVSVCADSVGGAGRASREDDVEGENNPASDVSYRM